MGGVKDVGGGGQLTRNEWVAVGDVENTRGEECKKLSQSHVTLVTPRDLTSHSLHFPNPKTVLTVWAISMMMTMDDDNTLRVSLYSTVYSLPPLRKRAQH